MSIVLTEKVTFPLNQNHFLLNSLIGWLKLWANDRVHDIMEIKNREIIN